MCAYGKVHHGIRSLITSMLVVFYYNLDNKYPSFQISTHALLNRAITQFGAETSLHPHLGTNVALALQVTMVMGFIAASCALILVHTV